MYDKTAEEIAECFKGKITAKSLMQWAKLGYPVKKGSKIIRIPMAGVLPMGAKKVLFDLKAVMNFLENVRDEQWVSKNVNTPHNPGELRNPNTGLTSSSSTRDASKEQLTTFLRDQRTRI